MYGTGLFIRFVELPGQVADEVAEGPGSAQRMEQHVEHEQKLVAAAMEWVRACWNYTQGPHALGKTAWEIKNRTERELRQAVTGKSDLLDAARLLLPSEVFHWRERSRIKQAKANATPGDNGKAKPLKKVKAKDKTTSNSRRRRAAPSPGINAA